MPAKKYIVKLSAPERASLEKVSQSNRHSIREKTRARILLGSDISPGRSAGGCGSDAELASRFKVSEQTVANVRQRAHQRGALESIGRKVQRQRKAPKLNGRQEAQLVAVTCSAPPEGRTRWSLVLLRERLIEMQVVEHIGLETIRTTLKKRAQAVAEKDVVHPAARRCTLRGVSESLCKRVE